MGKVWIESTLCIAGVLHEDGMVFTLEALEKAAANDPDLRVEGNKLLVRKQVDCPNCTGVQRCPADAWGQTTPNVVMHGMCPICREEL